MASTTSTARELTVDLQDERVQGIAERLFKALCQQAGEGEALSVAVLMTVIGLSAVLHCESPTPQRNVFAVRRILRDLARNVRAHETCAAEDQALLAKVH